MMHATWSVARGAIQELVFGAACVRVMIENITLSEQASVLLIHKRRTSSLSVLTKPPL